MHKLNLCGEDASRLVGVLYGHDKGGKVYNYLGGAGLRTGDIVTPMVTHAVSGKTYKTLGRVVTTRSTDGKSAQNVIDNIDESLKTLDAPDQKSLPGYYPGWGMRKLNLDGE